MPRLVFLFLIIILFTGISVSGQNKKREKEIAKAKIFEKDADSLLVNKEYLLALEKFQNSAIIYEENKDWFNAAKNYRKAAWCYVRLKNDSAQYFIDQSFGLFLNKIKEYNDKEKLEKTEILYTQAWIFFNKRNYDSTLYYLEKGIKIINELNIVSASSNLMLSKYYQTFGWAYSNMSKLDLSLKYYFKELNILQNEKEAKNNSIYRAYKNIAYTYYLKKDYEKAKDFFWYIINNNSKEPGIWSAVSYFYLAEIHKREKQLDKALGFLLKAYDIHIEERGENSLEVAQVANTIGGLYSLMDKFDKAFEYLDKSTKIRKERLAETHPFVFHNLNALMVYYYKLGNFKKAVEMCEKMMDFVDKKDPSNKSRKSHIYYLTGISYEKQNKYDEAINCHHKSICEIINGLEYNEDLKNPNIFYEGTNIITDQYEIISKSKLYYYLLSKASAQFELYNLNTIVVENLSKSFDTYGLALQLLEVYLLEVSEENSKHFIIEKGKKHYIKAINIGLKLDSIFPKKAYKKLTLEFIDKSKSSILLNKIYTSNAINNFKIPAGLRQKEKEIARELAFYKTALSKKDANIEPQQMNEYKNIYNNLGMEYDTLNNYLEKTFPDYYKLMYTNKYEIDRIRSNIRENEAVLEYYIAGNRIVIIVIDNEGYELTTVPIDSTFNEVVLNYYKSIKKVDISEYITNNFVLYKKLILPIENKIEDKSSLIIIPDDYLYYIPFEALYKHSSTTKVEDFSNYHYLIKDHEIRYSYSLDFWMFNKNTHEKEKDYTEEFVGFAPVFEDDSAKLMALNVTDTITRSVFIDGKRFSKLIHTEKELNEISNLFRKADMKTSTYFYNDATEENFKNNVKDYRYIHISTHGFFDKLNSNLSGIAFYGSEESDTTLSAKSEDGLLYFSEMGSLELNADLVVLSACETGIGKLVKGEGLISFGRGFVIAGVPNLVYSLWNVPDKNTSDFMIEFYKGLLSGKTYSQSLRESKLKQVNNTGTSHPKIWSGFVLIGI